MFNPSKVRTFSTLTESEIVWFSTKHNLSNVEVYKKYQSFYSQVGRWSEQLDDRSTFLSNFDKYLEGRYVRFMD